MINNKSVILISLMSISFLATLTQGAVQVTRPQTHPDFPGKCYYEEAAYDVGEKFKPVNRCARASCRSDFSLSIATCGVSRVRGLQCREVGQNLELPYPQCCHKFECITPNGSLIRV